VTDTAGSDQLDRALPTEAAERLREVYERYDLAYRSAKPGTASAVTLARARLDLALLLDADAAEVELPELVQAQLERDAQTLLAVTPELG
jgi:hypothetical protein